MQDQYKINYPGRSTAHSPALTPYRPDPGPTSLPNRNLFSKAAILETRHSRLLKAEMHVLTEILQVASAVIVAVCQLLAIIAIRTTLNYFLLHYVAARSDSSENNRGLFPTVFGRGKEDTPKPSQ